MESTIFNGIYLVVDANTPLLSEKLEAALKGGINIVQLYNTHHPALPGLVNIINAICRLCHHYHVPVLVNNTWELIAQTELDGVHFDSIPENYAHIVQSPDRSFFIGLTCSNDLSLVKWAAVHQIDYISFCSMFPTVSAPTCTLVSFDSVRQAREMTTLPIFVAGGISLQNISRLSDLQIDGIALISGIMKSVDITETTKEYVSSLKKIILHAY